LWFIHSFIHSFCLQYTKIVNQQSKAILFWEISTFRQKLSTTLLSNLNRVNNLTDIITCLSHKNMTRAYMSLINKLVLFTFFINKQKRALSLPLKTFPILTLLLFSFLCERENPNGKKLLSYSLTVISKAPSLCSEKLENNRE
jgi:hypothetical protein